MPSLSKIPFRKLITYPKKFLPSRKRQPKETDKAAASTFAPLVPDHGSTPEAHAQPEVRQAPEPPPIIVPSTKLLGDWDVNWEPCEDVAVVEKVPSAPKAPPRRIGRIGVTAGHFLRCICKEENGQVVEVHRADFVKGLEAYAESLDALGGSLGQYLMGNVGKLAKSKASPSATGYLEWCLTELPVHGSTGYKSYVDDSAWMANLWIGWTLEFFVELYAQLHLGLETKAGVDVAYAPTLYHHHNIFQKTAFMAGVKTLPNRAHIVKILGQGGPNGEVSDDVDRDLGEFVAVARRIVKFVLWVNERLSDRLQQERAKR